eukprot:COSAG06_NODE_29410_length_557_cov_0.807860_2_plen_20_part_01
MRHYIVSTDASYSTANIATH